VHSKAKSRLSLTHLAVQPFSRVKTLDGPRVRVVSLFWKSTSSQKLADGLKFFNLCVARTPPRFVRFCSKLVQNLITSQLIH